MDCVTSKAAVSWFLKTTQLSISFQAGWDGYKACFQAQHIQLHFRHCSRQVWSGKGLITRWGSLRDMPCADRRLSWLEVAVWACHWPVAMRGRMSGPCLTHQSRNLGWGVAAGEAVVCLQQQNTAGSALQGTHDPVRPHQRPQLPPWVLLGKSSQKGIDGDGIFLWRQTMSIVGGAHLASCFMTKAGSGALSEQTVLQPPV